MSLLLIDHISVLQENRLENISLIYQINLNCKSEQLMQPLSNSIKTSNILLKVNILELSHQLFRWLKPSGNNHNHLS